MSGDVQPRKRKDKRRKQRDSLDRKSEGELLFSRQSSVQEDDESSHGVHITKMGTDDVHLHVHHEHGTGGHWCAKIFFFTLLAVLVGLISLIIMENRGISDLDTPLSESRFSNYFDGWVDEQRQSHDEHDAVQASLEEHDEHDEPFEEEDAVSEGDEEEEYHEEEEEGEEDHEEEEEEEDDDDDDDDEKVTKEDVDRTVENDNDGDGDDDDDDDDDDDNNEEDADNASVDGGEHETAEDDDDNDENEDDDEDDENDKKSIDEEETLSTEFVDHTAELNNGSENDENNDDDEDDNEDEADNNNTKENNKNSVNSFDEDDDDDDDDDGTFELFDKVVDNDAEELLILQKKAEAQAAKNPEKEEPASEENDEIGAVEDKPSWLRSLAVKLGVGLALALVARLVLLRKNPNTNDDGPTEAMMKRRLTMAGPDDTFPEDVDTPMLPTDELSDEDEIIEEEIIEFLEEEVEEEVEEEEEEEIEVDDDGVEVEMSGKYVPETFEQLNALYRAHEEPSPHPTAKHQPHIIHTPETPSSLSSKEMPIMNLNEKEQSVSSQIQHKPPPVFIAPPPPPPTIITPLREELNQSMTTNRDKSRNESPKKNSTEPSSTPITKRSVAHDVDYQPVADDSRYDDDEIDYSDEMDEEDEVDDDEDIDDDEDVSDIDEISDVDDTDLMKRLEAKYGKLPPSSAEKEYESDEDPDDPTWTQIKPKETVDGGGAQAFDEEEDSFEAQLHRAQAELARENFAAAFRTFNKLVNEHPDQPQSFYEQCRALNEYIRSRKVEELKNDALYICKRYLAFGEDITDPNQYRLIAEITLNIIEDLGMLHQAIDIFENLLHFFPSDLNYMKRYAEVLIKTGKLHQAKNLLSKILVIFPNDGLALAHYGSVLLQLAQNHPGAIRYLQRGIDTNEESTHKAFFYLKLGEAYQRQEKYVEAFKVYERAVELKLFPSIMQRAIYYVPNLRAQPFWSVDETTYGSFLNSMRTHWRIIREEGLGALKMEGFFKNESENLRESGTWQMWVLWAQGKRNDQNCQKAPFTCALIAEIPAVRNFVRGQVKFSVMLPKTHVWPHCGPTNARLRGHLGLVVPEDTEIRVGNEKRSWAEGEFLIFDDSFEHEVWQNGNSYRLILIVDMCHPDLTEEQRKELTPL